MEHFLLTRFNVQWAASLPADQSGMLHLNPAWLTHRLDLFRRICHPSVMAQTVPMRWLLFASDQTPDPWRTELEQTEGTEVIWSPPWDDALPAKAVEDRRTSDLIVTTRLDNDDALSRTHLADVQAAATHPGQTIAPSHGYQLYLHEQRAYTRTHAKSPFLSLVEDGPARTALALAHARLGHGSTDLPGRQFLQTIHDRNIDNPPKGRHLVARRRVLDDVAMDESLLTGPTGPLARARSTLHLARRGIRNRL